MTSSLCTDSLPTDLITGPRKTLQKYDTEYTLLGTAHVSRASADEVRALIRDGDFDAVAIELCPGRLSSIADPDALSKLDLFQVIREGKAGMVAANLALGAFQQRVAEESGISPGEEMKAAIEEAKARDLPLLVIDRDVGITLKRVYRSVPWWQRAGLISGLIGSLLSREKVTAEEIEKLKEGDVLEATFSEFAAESEKLYQPLIAERDHYMALRLAEENGDSRYKKVLVVVGAGHLKGLEENLKGHLPDNPREQLRVLESVPAGSRWPKLIPWIIAALILTGFAVGFSRSTTEGLDLVMDWVLVNGGLSALGVLIAGGHPLTILTAFLAAPLTSLNPTIGAGFVAAAVELYMRKPKVSDFSHLRQDTASVRGWWRNRVSRTLLVFILATLGSAIGTYVGGFIVYEQLFDPVH
ncbi:TraB/GumN family protein [Marinospirillum alkaliphilum]|uniref:Pheromone shutdown-related protein TraB n=1 Tax=Marinospirillum alkaliphilum DSM 21637 TaxID=1122209 RepID=A0A1K1VX68_9GAMM|nr:TraB/GumN family protein [Marinospirillum alkaliphilum]SFX29758.1 pheromone shutdown-related protein TraB [Marinospirillum alkaliphilum DSM 21637]